MDPLIAAGVALITGSGSGIGRNVALKFAEKGCRKFFLVDVSLPGLKETKRLMEEIAESANTVLNITNVTKAKEVEDMVNKCVAAFGRIDFAVNNAGIARAGVRTTDTSTEMFDQMAEVNEKGVFLCTKYETKQMLTQPVLPIFAGDKAERNTRGSIVNTCSLSGFTALENLAAYTASKHAVLVLTRVDARQYAPHGIRVNCISPGFVLTPLMTGAGLSDEFYETVKKETPQGRLTGADEVGEGVVFLSGSGASAVTGVSLSVDTGASLYHVY